MRGRPTGTGVPPADGGRRRTLLRRLGCDRRGTSAVEFGLIGSIFAVLLLNVVDFSMLIWSRMQVDYAAAVGAQAAYNICSPGPMPAMSNCQTMPAVVAAAIQSTSLGTGVQLDTSPNRPGLSEGYYCTIGTDLRFVGDTSAQKPPNCLPDNPDPTATPGDYVIVNVKYQFTPLFSGLSFVVSGQQVMAMAMQRLR
jgi:hypothetical protein